MKEVISNQNHASSYDETYIASAHAGFVVAFIHPLTNQPIFLADSANISEICYSQCPKLPGTSNIKYAKIYQDLESAKSDIYLLRYHHRNFLKILTIAKPIVNIRSQSDFNVGTDLTYLYDPTELMIESQQ